MKMGMGKASIITMSAWQGMACGAKSEIGRKLH